MEKNANDASSDPGYFKAFYLSTVSAASLAKEKCLYEQ